MAHSFVSPEDLRFTQDSIKNTFKRPYESQRIDDAVDQIGNNQLDPSVLMPLNVVQYKAMLWSLDNRRLWVFRKAGVPTVKVTFVPLNHSRRSVEFFSSLNDPHEVRRYCSATYFPRVRGGVRSVALRRGKGMSDGVQMLYPTKEAADVKRTTGIPPSLIPHHLRSGTISIDMPAKVINYEASSNCFHKESNPIPRSKCCPEKVRFTQHSTSSGGAPPPKPLLFRYPTNNTLPKTTTTAAPHLRDVNIFSPANGAAPPPTPSFLHQNPTQLANTTYSKSISTTSAAPHLRDVNIFSLANGAAPPPTLSFLLRDVNIFSPANGAAPPPTLSFPHQNPTQLAKTTFPTRPPLSNHGRDGLRSTSHLPSNNGFGAGEKEGSGLWAKTLNFVWWVKIRVFGCFGCLTAIGDEGDYNSSV